MWASTSTPLLDRYSPGELAKKIIPGQKWGITTEPKVIPIVYGSYFGTIRKCWETTNLDATLGGENRDLS